jgi:hypothetical protein
VVDLGVVKDGECLRRKMRLKIEEVEAEVISGGAVLTLLIGVDEFVVDHPCLCQHRNEGHVLALGQHSELSEVTAWSTTLLDMDMEVGWHFIDENEGSPHVVLHLIDDKGEVLETSVFHLAPPLGPATRAALSAQFRDDWNAMLSPRHASCRERRWIRAMEHLLATEAERLDEEGGITTAGN